MSILYRSTNRLTKKSYIGFTSRPLRKRIIEHKSQYKKIDSKFYNAIRKYGWDSFLWEILLYDATLDDEIQYIKNFNTINEGYNILPGGHKILFTEEVRRKMSLASKGKPKSKEFREKRRQIMLGSVHTPETKKKIAEANSYDWLIIDPNNKEFQITNLNMFCKENNLNVGHMHAVSTGHRNHHKGFRVKKIKE